MFDKTIELKRVILQFWRNECDNNELSRQAWVNKFNWCSMLDRGPLYMRTMSGLSTFCTMGRVSYVINAFEHSILTMYIILQNKRDIKPFNVQRRTFVLRYTFCHGLLQMHKTYIHFCSGRLSILSRVLCMPIK